MDIASKVIGYAIVWIGFVATCVGLISLVVPISGLLVPTRRRAVKVLLAGFVTFAVGTNIVDPPSSRTNTSPQPEAATAAAPSPRTASDILASIEDAKA